MAFDPNGLRRVFVKANAASGAPSAHHTYDINDAAATVEAANYFNAAAGDLQKGDTIQATMAKSGTPVAKMYVVTVNTGTAVTIAVATAAAG